MTLHCSILWLYFILLDSILLYHASASLFLTWHYSTMALYFTPHNSAMALHYSALLYIGSASLCLTLLHSTLLWLYFILLDSVWLYHGSSSLYLTLHDSPLALLHSTSLHVILKTSIFWAHFQTKQQLCHNCPSHSHNLNAPPIKP